MNDGLVHIVDDEQPVRDSIAWLLRSAGLRSQQHPSAHAFLATYSPDEVGCLVLDMRMPHMDGLELQQELNRRGWSLPVIFVTGHGDVPLAVRAMRDGAIDFLQKPFNAQELIGRVRKAIDQDLRHRQQSGDREGLLRRVQSLTPREREVAQRIVAGQANKVIAMELDISERTVEQHRGRLTRKLGVRGTAQLVQTWLLAEPDAAPP